MRPSFISASIGAIFMTIALFFFIKNLRSDFSFDPSSLIIILLLFSLAFGMHGISHSIEEIYFDFNPLVGKWKLNDEPKKINNF